MEDSGVKMPSAGRCDKLRWKAMFVDAIQDPAMASGDDLFWCHATQTCLGPDGQLASGEECTSTRPCFRPL